MANIYETERESDDDGEIYFLKPVNEYNIVDKIKEANKELFAHENLTLKANEANNENVFHNVPINRKVSFAANLEEYEPQNGTINSEQLLEKLSEESKENNCANKLEIIVEEPQHEEEEPRDELIQTMDSTTQPEEFIENLIEIFDETTKELKKSSDEATVDEICEEIIIMDMENDNTSEQNETIPRHKSSSPSQRKILKQFTFDCDDNEGDNESLTNLLISDNDNANDIDNKHNDEFNCNESVCEESEDEYEKLQTNHSSEELFVQNVDFDDDEEDDDDDKLSIIVASCIPDDDYNSCDQPALTTTECSAQRTHNESQNKLSFGKHFSFGRNSNSFAAIRKSSRRFKPPSEVTDLKLHYKVCCEYKHTQQNLPKYTGYLSEYGLSREQLIERDRKLHQKHRSLLQQTLKATETEVRKMHDNERAFVKWLKNKMRFPVNKTRNMFDVKRSFGGIKKISSIGGNDGEINTNTSLTNQHQIIRNHSASNSRINEI
uniref:Coiled-coil domain-containing protein 181 n=1 Tax=Glossina brevipalpis TaxID=37001 RepID=A0A1A9WSA5_9MUSC